MVDTINIYRGQDGVFEETPVAVMALDESQVSIPDQYLPPDTIWHYIRRRVSGDCELESPDSPVCIVRINSDGDMIGNIPNAPTNLAAEGLADGKVKLRWRYAPFDEEFAPAGFHIYIDSGAGFDFATPDATVLYRGGGPKAGEFEWTSESLTHGELYRFCVRSYRTVADYKVTGELTPDAAGDYWYAGEWDGYHYYRRGNDVYYIYELEYGCYRISPILGGENIPAFSNMYSGILGEYQPIVGAEGIATVSAIPPGSGESQNTNSVSITADSVGPDAIINLIATVEEIQ
jgi:hypothetical protein